MKKTARILFLKRRNGSQKHIWQKLNVHLRWCFYGLGRNCFTTEVAHCKNNRLVYEYLKYFWVCIWFYWCFSMCFCCVDRPAEETSWMEEYIWLRGLRWTVIPLSLTRSPPWPTFSSPTALLKVLSHNFLLVLLRDNKK